MPFPRISSTAAVQSDAVDSFANIFDEFRNRLLDEHKRQVHLLCPESAQRVSSSFPRPPSDELSTPQADAEGLTHAPSESGRRSQRFVLVVVGILYIII